MTNNPPNVLRELERMALGKVGTKLTLREIAAMAHMEILKLRADLQSIMEKTAAPVNTMAEREAVHFAYNTARRALEEMR